MTEFRVSPGLSDSSGVRTLRSGGIASARCVSRYGVQDLVGNVWEWTSDQCESRAGTCTGVTSALVSSENPHINDIPLAELFGGGGDNFCLRCRALAAGRRTSGPR
ncbi:MAG: SUMF1/EgtB/PvdO family nonheme iron enzyme [Polyangiales bacterium]